MKNKIAGMIKTIEKDTIDITIKVFDVTSQYQSKLDAIAFPVHDV